MAKRILIILSVIVSLSLVSAWSNQVEAKELVKETPSGPGDVFAEQAAEKMGYKQGDNVLCITNAGYAGWQGKDTYGEMQALTDAFGCSPGNGNLFMVHARMDAPPWFILTRKNAGGMTSVCGSLDEKGELTVSDPVEVAMSPDLDYNKVKEACGKVAYSAVGFSNTWAWNAPHHLILGALYHNHFCPGVTSGYMIAKWLLENEPLEPGESYVMIGLPQWCKEDSLTTALDVTPGKHGYYAMNWTEAQKAALPEKTVKDIAGFFIKVKSEKREFVQARVIVLGFDFHKEEFFEELGDNKHPDLSNLQLLKGALDQINDLDYFVFPIAEKTITDKSVYEQLMAPGGDPFEIMGLYK